MSIIRNRREQKRFAKFAIVGAIGAGVDFLTFNLFFALLGLPPVPASVISFLAAVTSNFILNRHWTFPDSRSKAIGTQMAQYGLVNLIGLLIRTPIFAGLSALFINLLNGRKLPLSLGSVVVAHNLALAGAIGVVLFWNFFINRYWTYGDVE